MGFAIHSMKSVLGPFERLGFSRFLFIKVQCLWLISSVSISVQKRTQFRITMVVSNYWESWPSSSKDWNNVPSTRFTRGLGCCESWTLKTKAGGRWTEAEAESHKLPWVHGCNFVLKLSAVGQVTPYLHIFEQYKFWEIWISAALIPGKNDNKRWNWQ